MTVLRPFLPFALLIAGGAPALAETVSVQGAGATFPAPLYAKWISTFNAAHADSHIDYQPIGSGGGIKGITDGTIQFAGSDAPMTDEQMAKAPGVIHLPTVAGPVVMIYHVDGIDDKTQLIFDGPTIGNIYLGNITKWNDKAIAATNPGVALPDIDIVVVHRSDGSGTTWIFTNYLTKVAPDWSKVGNATSVKWPVGLGGKGNAGVSQAVQNAHGAIGYVELAYAVNSKLVFAKLVNHDGKAVDASIAGVVAAAKNSPPPPEDFRLSITDAPGAESYPICGFTYLLVHSEMNVLKNPEQAKALVSYIQWCETDGQEVAALDYARLPEAMQAAVIKKLSTITLDGKPIIEAK